MQKIGRDRNRLFKGDRKTKNKKIRKRPNFRGIRLVKRMHKRYGKLILEPYLG